MNEKGNASITIKKTPWLMLILVTLSVGFASGLGGMGLGLLLHLVQHIAYGHGLHTIAGRVSFLQEVTAASDLRRFLALCSCGAVAGIGWWLLYRFGSPLVSIRQAVQKGGHMPFWATLTHAILQIVTVGLGSPLGREVAPRELGAALATRLCARANLTPECTRIMIACGAGAGLAAVYNVPLGGTLFTLEVLLGTFSVPASVAALATCVIATLVARLGLGNGLQYSVPPLAISPSIIVWSLLAGPVLGVAAYLFVKATEAGRARAPKDWRLAAWCSLVFPIIGLLAIPFPQLLGNGKGLAQSGFDNEVGLALAATLLMLRVVVLVASLRAGAEGGLLTPGLSIGALLGIILGSFWNHAWPTGSLADFAIIGGAAFLAASMKMPLTAIVLTVEFTGIGQKFLIPLSLAVAGSVSIFHLCRDYADQLMRGPAAIRVYERTPEPLPAGD
jgi:chloride channel protein, CIC family